MATPSSGQKSLVSYGPWGRRKVKHNWATNNNNLSSFSSVLALFLTRTKILFWNLQQLLFVYWMTHASGRHSVYSTGWHNFFQTSALLLQQALSTTLNCSVPKHFLSFPTSMFSLSVLPLPKHLSCIFHSPVLSEPYTQYGAHRSCPMETACFHAGLTHSCLISFIFCKLLKASKISIKSIIPRHNSLYIIHNK